MKKLIFVVALFAVLVGISFAQEWSTTTAVDTVYIKITAKMMGVAWSWDIIGPVAAITCLAGGGTVGDLDPESTYVDFNTGGAGVAPCCSLAVMGMVENTGGVSLDFNLLFAVNADTVTGDPWDYSPDGWSNCKYDQFTAGYFASYGAYLADDPNVDGLTTTPASPAPEDYNDLAGAVWTGIALEGDVINNLAAEDPDHRGDGLTYDPGEIDCAELIIALRVPASALNQNIHIMKSAVRGYIGVGD
jgi:hypothetical protein